MRWTKKEAQYLGSERVGVPPAWRRLTHRIFKALRPFECYSCKQPIATGQPFMATQTGHAGCQKCWQFETDAD